MAFSVRWKNFRGFKDTNWIDIKPLTILIGPNASGKTSFIAPLLLLKQTLESHDNSLLLKTKGDIFNAGTFKDIIYSHDINKNVSLSIRTHSFQGMQNKSDKPLWEDPPGVLKLVFKTEESLISLKKFEILDIYGRRMITRNLQANGKYSLLGLNIINKQRSLIKFIRQSMPDHFLFSSYDPLFKSMFETVKDKRDNKKKKKKSSFKVLKPEQHYINSLNWISSEISDLLENISFIGPLRENPHRLYRISGEKPLSVGIRGEYAPEILFRSKNLPLLKDTNRWISKFDFGLELIPLELSDDAFRITFRRTKKSTPINLADTGFGVSQILPLIVQGLYSKKNTIMIAEQPEIHLNPKLQSELADLFVEISGRLNGIIVETHSEHLLLRIRRLIAEKKISANNVALYFFEKDKDSTIIKTIPIEKNGHIGLDSWPMGFFQESLKDSIGLASAQLKVK